MRDRVRNIKRIIEVQKHLHDMEELKYARLKQTLERCQADQHELANALSGEDALHGLFTDVTVRRLKSLQQEEIKILPAMEAQARVVVAHGGRLRNSERLAEELGVELRRMEEREELDQLLEARFVKGGASSKQDR